MSTDRVLNQPPPLQDYDPLALDQALAQALRREGAAWATAEIGAFARATAAEEMVTLVFKANESPPRLRTHDRFGNRLDEVDFHPAWHELMRFSVANGVHAGPWRDPREGAHVARAAKMLLVSQTEAGHGCPISMTYSALPPLQRQPDLLEEWAPRIVSLAYDGRMLPAAEKTSALAGMGMTEKQGGSDVRANTTRAVAQPDGSYLLTGHKWFTSAPMCDVFLVLAQAEGGLTCFLVPRVLPDGTRNTFRIQRLKDKLGNRSNASSEPEFEDTVGWRVGDEGRGVRTIIEMVNMTRLDCVIGSAALMRRAVAEAMHHTAHRRAFGAYLVDQPLMQNVLADLAVESEAATVLMLRLAAATDDGEAALRRVALAAGKYWVCKRGPVLAAEALECLGGNGFVEDFPLAALYREAPLNSIWEGSGNVNALDVLRAMRREPECLSAYDEEIQRGAGADARLDTAIKELRAG